MTHNIVDTNVPLTAAGYNNVATRNCRNECIDFLEHVFRGDVIVVIDNANAALNEYANNLPRPLGIDNLASRFLIHLYNNRGNEQFIKEVALAKSTTGQFLDYPDNAGSWKTDDPRCKRFDEDDKKWVAIALRFKSKSGDDAPIACAADHCWSVFELILKMAGVQLDFVCNRYPTTN
ncbi:MAG: hypothetical protein OXE95_01260 [Chloroflexi bacterium]|nr:hypothetical protein [Chloroflexota bacterium]MCY4246187.1 hypothetical protein [Chloroflexota bacterium]